MTPDARLPLTHARDHVKANRLAAAEAEVSAVLQEEPENLSAQTLLGLIYFRMGRTPQADQLLSEVIQKGPNQLDAIGLLAVIRKSRKDLLGAAQLFQRSIDLGQTNADIYNQLGSCRLEMGDAVAAGAAFKKAIELDRSLVHSYYNLGMALKLGGTSLETFSTFKRVVEIDPDFISAYVELWQQVRKLHNWNECVPILENGLRRHPDSAQMMVMLALTYGKVGKPDKAEELFKSAAAMDPAALPPYSHWLHEEGRFEDSIPVLKEAIRLDPQQCQAYYNLAIAKCFEIDGASLIDLVSPLLDQESIGMEGRMWLYYALAKSYDQQKNYELAMRHYDLANDHAYCLFNSEIKHEAAAIEEDYAALTKLYSKEAIGRLRKHGSESEIPVFIVGMIRTGTTLLDQILSNHPQVKSAGEQPFWQVSAGRVNRRWLESGGNADDIKELKERYLEAIQQATGGAKRVTDKMPTNFWHMGLISVVFPKAKFIHLRRNPLDTCLSIYTTFLGKGTQFAYSQENIVSYYRAYLHTMDYWRTVIPPEQMIEIDYEDLVTNKEQVLREVVAFCSLEWDDSLLRHEGNRGQVSTPSLWAVRQPVNAASVGKWRRYEPWMGALLQLKDLV